VLLQYAMNKTVNWKTCLPLVMLIFFREALQQEAGKVTPSSPTETCTTTAAGFYPFY